MKGIINFAIVFKVLSRNLFILTAALAFCIGIALIYAEPTFPFILSSCISMVLGLSFYFITRNKHDDSIDRKDAYLTVTLTWLFISLIGSLPYLFSRAIPSFTDAFFESVSGFTTTGSSILTDIEILPKSILFWRSLTHWIGGIGIIVLFIIIMPSLKIGGYHLFTMESSLQEKTHPKIKTVGNRLLMIYLILTFSEVIFLLAGGMDLFDSVCHAFGTAATGGFSPKNTSIGGYSPYIQYVVMIFMLLAGTNFIIHYFILKRDFNKVRINEELKFYLSVIAVIGLIITAALYFKTGKSLELSFRESFFQIISIVTCTGFATADYLVWPTFAWVIIFLAMFLGGSTGSTAGGIKMARHLILMKNLKRSFKQLTFPNAILTIRFNKSNLDEHTNHSILTFIFVYLLVFIFGSILLVILGIDGKTAAGSVATCMAGIGPGIGTVGPAANFAHLPETAKFILLILMLVGRLEIYTILMLFYPEFWRN